MASIRKLPNRKTKPWRVEIRKAGKSPISETFKTKKEAQAFAAKIEGNFDKWAKLLGGELRRHTLEDLIDRYIRQYRGKDPSIVTRAGWWRDTYGDRSLAEFTNDTVREGLATLEESTAKHGGHAITTTEKRRSPATINRYRTAVAAVFRVAIDKGWYGISDNPAAGIRQKTESNSRYGRCLEDDERAAILAACDASAWDQLGLFVRLALATGARRGELLKLQWRDVDLKRGTVLFRDTKNEDDRRVPLIGEAWALLKAASKVRKLKQPGVFNHPTKEDNRPPVDWYWQKARKAAGVDNLRLHDLRHSCGSYLARNGASAFQIAAILGHRSGPTLTARYVHLAAEDSRDLMESALSGALGGAMTRARDRRQERLSEVERALNGEPGIARELLYDIHQDLIRHTNNESVDREPVQLDLVGVEYLRRAIPMILGGIPADVALGLKSGTPGHPIVSQDSAWWRSFLVRAGVRELLDAGTVPSKTAAFKHLAKQQQYPDLHDYSRELSLSWTTVRDIYYGRKL